MTEFIAALFIALLVGFVIGWRAGTRNAVCQPASGQISVKYSGPAYVGPREFPLWGGEQ